MNTCYMLDSSLKALHILLHLILKYCEIINIILILHMRRLKLSKGKWFIKEYSIENLR